MIVCPQDPESCVRGVLVSVSDTQTVLVNGWLWINIDYGQNNADKILDFWSEVIRSKGTFYM